MTGPVRALWAVVGAACLAAGACQGAASIDHSVDHQAGRLVTLGVPGHLNQTPGVAAEGALVAVSWTTVAPDSGADAYVAVSQDEGSTFGPPVRVNDAPGEVRPSEQQAPRIAVRDGAIVVLWTSRRGSATAVRLATSTDHGRSFGASQAVSPSGAPGTRGWGSLLVDDRRQIHVLWLDTRASASSTPPAPSAGPAGPHMHGGAAKPEVRQDVYEATIGPDSVVHERLVATGVCFCCKTALAQQGSAVWGAWRDVYAGSLRDITIARLAPSGDLVRARVSLDHWKIDGCPEDGPALVAGPDGSINIIWPTLVTAEPLTKGVFFATSMDGQTFSARVRLDEGRGSASHPAVAATPSGHVLAVWEVAQDRARRIEIRQRRGADWQPVIRLTVGPSASSPSVAAVAQGFVVAWGRRDSSDTTSAIEVRYVPASR